MAERYDVVVIGAGLLGCLTAWMVARDHGRVLLVEKDQVNQHASGQNAGSLHFQLEYRMIEKGPEEARVAAEALPLHLRAAQMWSDLEAEIGEPMGVMQTGGLMLAESPEQLKVLESKAELERSWGLQVSMLDRSELDVVAPYLSERVLAANYCAQEGKADARTAAPAVARAAIAAGAYVQTRTRVVQASRAAGHWTLSLVGGPDEGRIEKIICDSVVIAAGVWTTEVGRLFNAILPTVPLALTMTVTGKTPALIPHLVQHAGTRLSLKQSHDQTILIGGGWPGRLMGDGQTPLFEKKRELIPSSLAGNMRAALAAVPALGRIPVFRSWVGTTTVAPDQLPLVGPVAGAPGVFVATGGSAFTLGPVFARVLIALISGQSADSDLRAYDPARFSEPTHHG